MVRPPEPGRITPRSLDQAPLTDSQESLWFLQHLDPENHAYNSNLLVKLTGDLNVTFLETSLEFLVARHQPLRTIYPLKDSGPIAHTRQSVAFHLPLIDLTNRSKEDCERQFQISIKELADTPYNLEQGPLFRVALFRFSESEHLLFFGTHHIGSDAWSREVFQHELFQAYADLDNGQPIQLPQLPISYSDYAQWQRDWMQGETQERFLDHWMTILSGDLPTLDLPLDFPRPAEQTYQGARQEIALGEPLLESIRQFCRQERITPFHFFMTAYALLLARYTGQEDILIGCPFANRHAPELANLLGLFINTLPIRLDLSENPSIRELLLQVRQVMVEAGTWSALPFETLVAKLSPERDLSRTPIYQVSINMRNVLKFEEPRIPDLQIEQVEFEETQVPLDLTLEFETRNNEQVGFLKFNTHLFSATTIQKMAIHYGILLHEIIGHPDEPISEIQMLSPLEIGRLVSDPDWIKADFPSLPVHELFAARAKASPHKIALEFNDQSLSYRELEFRSNQLANYLLGKGLTPGSTVAILLPRSTMSIVSLLAVLKTGCAFMPVDNLSPAERLTAIFSESKPALVITEATLRDQVPAGFEMVFIDQVNELISRSNRNSPGIHVDQKSLMHIMFTSGSTGKPKGIRNDHSGFVNYMQYTIKEYRVTNRERMLQHTSLAWDASLFEVFIPLLSGGTLVLLDENKRSNPAAIVNTILDKRITIMKAVPTLLRAICENAILVNNPLNNLRLVFSVGEVLFQKDLEMIHQAFDDELKVINQYGPTECSGIFTNFLVPEKFVQGRLPSIPIGTPILNNRVYLLDKHQNPVPSGVKGEIYLAGVGVGRGYLNQPEIDGISFLPDPYHPGEKMYRTGDIGKRLADGSFLFLGRSDNQVKIRGYRVELSEIENVLSRFSWIGDNAVLLWGAGESAKLVAYIQKNASLEEGFLENLKHFLSEQLPFYMVPSQYVFLDSFPLTSSGKIDRNKLPAPVETSPIVKPIPPENDLECEMLGIWEAVLGFSGFGIRENFFHLGGHSLMAVRLMAAIERKFGKPIPLVALFHDGTVEGLTKYLSKQENTLGNGIVTIHREGKKTPIYIVASGIGLNNLGESLIDGHPIHLLFAYKDGKPVYLNSVQDSAAIYYQCLTSFQPAGPYCLIGHSGDGQFALELARMLLENGHTVDFLGLIDSYPHSNDLKVDQMARIKFLFRFLTMKSPMEAARKIWRKIRWRSGKIRAAIFGQRWIRKWQEQGQVRQVKHFLMRQYVPKPYPGDVTYFSASYDMVNVRHDLIRQWQSLVKGKLTVIPVLGDHTSVIQPPYVADLGKKILAEIEKHEREG